MSKSRPVNIGQLKSSGWQSRSVRQELRQNLIRKIEQGEPVFDGIVGYEQTVIPQIENAILSQHNFILLGLRGQAKSRILRQLQSLLDDHIPVIAGSMLNEDPLHPITPRGLRMVAEMSDDMPIEWLRRDERYHEKLATPDVSIADLIGDIDPIKAAREKLDISNDEVIHWGIIPRTNRGIFAINELPDLQPRIQVGLLNILEESDIQVRGFPLRVPLDMLLVFTANPEDYTNRGNIITPLKDRIDSQILTHYPRSIADARAITTAEAQVVADDIVVPEFLKDIIEQVAFEARTSEYIDQTSGVSARVSISAYENFVANIERRRIRRGNSEKYPRLSDLYAMIPAISGKIELVYEGEQEGPALVAMGLVGRAINEVFLDHFPQPTKGDNNPDAAPLENPYEAVTDFFGNGQRLELSDTMTDELYCQTMQSIPGLRQIVDEHFPSDSERETLLRMELVLEGLYQNGIIARQVEESVVTYGDVFSEMLKGMEDKR